MKLAHALHVVGGGWTGFNISGARDCHVYLLDGGSELALIDSGLGLADDFSTILENIRADGLDPRRIRKIILTHYHADHIGAAREARSRLDAEVIASHGCAPAIRAGDELPMGLQIAKAAGVYPLDYHIPACAVDRTVGEGDMIQIGALLLRTFDTPGHSDGHISFLLEGADRTVLIGGDLVFWNGTILLQNLPDCRIDAYASSVAKVATLDFDALLPGHGQISLRGGAEHARKADRAFKSLLIPPNLL